jgi:hypothetical protein
LSHPHRRRSGCRTSFIKESTSLTSVYFDEPITIGHLALRQLWTQPCRTSPEVRERLRATGDLKLRPRRLPNESATECGDLSKTSRSRWFIQDGEFIHIYFKRKRLIDSRKSKHNPALTAEFRNYSLDPREEAAAHPYSRAHTDVGMGPEK